MSKTRLPAYIALLAIGTSMIDYSQAVNGNSPKSSTRSMHEYWRDMGELNREVAIQSSRNLHHVREIGTESVGRPLELLNEQNETAYEKYNSHNEGNSEKYEDLHEDSGARKRAKLSGKHHGGKRRQLSKCLNEWILFMFILHCLFAGALFGQHWNPAEPIAYRLYSLPHRH